MRRLIVSLLVFAHSLSCDEQTPVNVSSINETVSWDKSAVQFSAESIRLGFFLWRYIVPSSAQRLQNAQINELKERLLAEKALKECIVINAYSDRLPGQFPSACQSFDEVCAQAAGITRRNEIRDEFIQALEKIPVPLEKQHHYHSPTLKKIALGATIVVVSGGVLFFVSPVMIPGSLIAAKAVAASAAIKSCTLALASKATLESVALTMTALEAAHEAKKRFDALSKAEKMNTLLHVIKTSREVLSGASIIGSMVVGTPEQELKALIEQAAEEKSLRERIIEAHSNHGNND